GVEPASWIGRWRVRSWPMFRACPATTTPSPRRSIACATPPLSCLASLFGSRPMQPKPPTGFRVYDGRGSTTPAWHAPGPLLRGLERAPYPIDALPPSIRSVVQEISGCVQAPPEMVASSALAVASLAAQGLADVRRSTTLTGPIGLYFMTIAESGDRKSTADRLTGRPVYQFQDAQHDASKTTLANYAADLAAWQAKHDAKVSAMNNDAKGNKDIVGHQADLAQLETSKPQAPKVPRLIYTDVTQEKLMRALA